MEKKHMTNAPLCIKSLWEEGFFRVGRSLSLVSERITEKWGHNFPPSAVSKALARMKVLRHTGKRGAFLYIQKISPTSKKVESAEQQLFSDDLVNKFGKTFKIDFDDLHLNFDKSGNGTAFFLRKILEKAIVLAFTKNGEGLKLEDKSGSGKLLGLEAMIDVAAREKMGGIPFLLPKTAEKIKGAKFLGDTSAHNPLANVDMATILPQMPFIITAYKELAERLQSAITKS